MFMTQRLKEMTPSALSLLCGNANLVGSPVAVLREPDLVPSKVGPCLRWLGGGGSHCFWFFCFSAKRRDGT